MHIDLQLRVDVVGILPGLWQQAIVPVDVVRVEAQVALLHILLDWRALLVLPTPNLSTPFSQDPTHPHTMQHPQCNTKSESIQNWVKDTAPTAEAPKREGRLSERVLLNDPTACSWRVTLQSFKLQMREFSMQLGTPETMDSARREVPFVSHQNIAVKGSQIKEQHV
jgi:hypothetical protein